MHILHVYSMCKLLLNNTFIITVFFELTRSSISIYKPYLRSISRNYTFLQIKNDSMLEDLNTILNNGDVPNIYQADEVDKIYQVMRAPVQEAELQINRSNLFSVYLKAVRSNLRCHYNEVLSLKSLNLNVTFCSRLKIFEIILSDCHKFYKSCLYNL